jgi:hypothetical protein
MTTNFYAPNKEFGAQMCLRSGWLDFLKFSIDRVLKNHPLDGVYYDWNVALTCYNPAHLSSPGKPGGAAGHWDIDELLDLMEWTRKRVGPAGLVIIHNTTTPMYATENFADYVVGTEWGYGKWTDKAAELPDLPLEWSLAGAVPRGLISYGTIDAKAPKRLHKTFALEAFLGGMTPWPANDEALALAALLKPLGDVSTYRFADWRNVAVSLSKPHCASAVYSRPSEAYLLLANLEPTPREVTCVLHPDKLPYPLARTTSAAVLPDPPAQRLDVGRLTSDGVPVTIPGDSAILIRVQGDQAKPAKEASATAPERMPRTNMTLNADSKNQPGEKGDTHNRARFRLRPGAPGLRTDRQGPGHRGPESFSLNTVVRLDD